MVNKMDIQSLKVLKVPRYVVVKEELKNAILNGKYKPGDRIPPECKLTRSFNVSSITVIKALKELEREGLIYRQQGKGTFVKERISSVKEVGVIFFDIFSAAHPFLHQVLLGLEDACKNYNYNLHLYPIRGRDIETSDSLLKKLILQRELRGFIILSPIAKKNILFLKENQTVFVTVNIEYCDISVPSVLIDSFRYSFYLTESLIKKGFKKIGLIVGRINKPEEIGNAKKIFEGYKSAMERYSLPLCKEVIKDGKQTKNNGYLFMKQLLEERERPDAVIISGNILIDGAVEAIKEKGLRHPEDIFLTGLCDTKNRYNLPLVQLPLYEIGATAIKLLDSLVKDETIKNEKIILPVAMDEFARIVEGKKQR